MLEIACNIIVALIFCDKQQKLAVAFGSFLYLHEYSFACVQNYVIDHERLHC